MSDREILVFKSKLAEQTERYEDMVLWMHEVAEMDTEMSIEERNLLSVAYKNVIGSKRASWRIVTTLEQRELDKQNCRKDADEDKNFKDDLAPVQEYKKKVECELQATCDKVLDVLKGIISRATNDESKVFYYKMQGDYNRYLSEFTTGQRRTDAAEASLMAYKKATEEANSLEATHPIRLGLALNFSVFYYEILNQRVKACELAQQTFECAVAELDSLSEDSYKDSTLIMQLLRDNLTLWTSEVPAEDDQVELQDVEEP